MRSLTVGNVVDAYLRHYETESDDEVLSNSIIARKWIGEDLRGIRIADLATYHLQVWRDNLVLEGGVSKATANPIWTVLRAALSYGYDKMGVTDAERWKRIKPYGGTSHPRADYLTPEQAIALLNAMPADFRDLALGALYTGGRYREVRLTQVRHVNVRDGLVEFVFTKSGKRREVPLSSEGLALRQAGRRSGSGRAGVPEGRRGALGQVAAGSAHERRRARRRASACAALPHAAPHLCQRPRAGGYADALDSVPAGPLRHAGDGAALRAPAARSRRVRNQGHLPSFSRLTAAAVH